MIDQREKDDVPDITEDEFAHEIKARMEKSRFSMVFMQQQSLRLKD